MTKDGDTVQVTTEGPESRESGAILVYVAIMIPVLFAACAIAVDIARWYVEVQRVQRAADAAALAAAPYMPGSIGGSSDAYSVASKLVTTNGFNASTNHMTLDQAGLSPTQVRVTLDSTVANGFGSLFGVNATKITRSAVGEFTGPAPLGSPCNHYGNEPEGSGSGACTSYPQFWATIYGPEIYKTQGDQFATRKCGIEPYRESNCSSGSRGSANEDFDPRGYAITIKVREDLSNALTVQLYDPAYVDTGGLCDQLPNITTNTLGSNSVTDARTRYAANATGSPSFCAGDADNSSYRFPLTGSGGGSTSFDTEVPTVTSFGLIKPTDTYNPFDTAANASGNRYAQCTKQYPGFRKNGDGDGSWSATSGTTIPSGNATQQLSSNNALTDVFHKWVDLCTIPGPIKAGDYYLRVRSNVAWGASDDTIYGFADNSSVQGNGSNRFAVRAFTSNSSDSSKISVSPYARMPIFANTNNATTEFHLIRVTPQSAGANIVFTFFDVGDATTETGGSGTLTVLPPSEAKVGAANFTKATDCTAEGSLYGNAPTVTPDPAPTGSDNCFVSGIRNNLGFNGQQWKLTIPVPSGYDCTVSDPYGCWWKLRVAFTNTSSVTDQTTWTASLDGDPVRLVE